MKITKLKLKGYKRFFLNNIDEVIYTPKEIVQIIVSRNGSGKSSLLRMLSPLPADLKKEFNEDGYKIIYITKDKNEYEISSGYYVKGKHSFKINGVEHNHSGIKKIQLELSKEHFNITPDIFNILLGQKNFTTMSLQERKYWLTEISNVDYKYVVNVFNKTKQRHRDIVGSAKVLQDNILKSEAMLIDNKELTKLETDRKYLNSYIEQLLSTYNNDINTDIDIDKGINILRTKYLQFKNIYLDINGDEHTIEDYVSMKTKSEQEIVTITKLIKEITDKLNLLDNKPEDITVLKSQIDNIKKEMNDIEKYNKFNLDLNKIDDIVSMFKDVYTDLVISLSSITDLDDLKVDNESMDKMKVKHDTYSKLTDIYKNKIDMYNEHIDIMLKNKTSENKIVCNSCGNEWYHNYDEVKLKEYNKELIVFKNKLDSLNKNKTIPETYEKMVKKRDTINNVKVMLTSNQLLKNIFSSLLHDKNMYTDSITNLLNDLDNVVIVLDKLKYWGVLNNELEKLTKSYNEQVIKSETIKKLNIENIKELDIKLSEYTNRKNQLLVDINTYSKKISVLSKVKDSYDDLLNTLKALYKVRDKKIKYIQNQHTMKLINSLKEEVMLLNEKIDATKHANDKYKKDKEFLQQLKDKEKILKIMVKELSPNEGLIAESISRFLNVFIEDINFVINSVWTYPMELLPITITESDDLSYRFEVKVDNNAVIEDISKLSSSMQEITDLAFRVVFMKYLNLTDFPLILDEFGKTMDETHRIAAYNTIDKLIHSDFSQVFIVSHFNSVYARFTNTDFNVLDKNNVDMGGVDKYNSCLKLKYI